MGLKSVKKLLNFFNCFSSLAVWTFSQSMIVGLSMMRYTSGNADKTCLGDCQLSGLIGK